MELMLQPSFKLVPSFKFIRFSMIETVEKVFERKKRYKLKTAFVPNHKCEVFREWLLQCTVVSLWHENIGI